MKMSLAALFLSSLAFAADPRVAKSETVEIALAGEPPLRLTLRQLMTALDVPGVSVAIIDDFKVVSARGYGVSAAGTKTPVTPHTLFQAASISKPVTATAALALVEKGTLSLETDVNAALTSWKVQQNEFTKGHPVTLRQLISHVAGTTVHGFGGYAVNTPVPTVLQILDGEKPANSLPVRVDFQPGSKERYSGGGITIEQLLLTDVTGEAFPALLQRLVLGPAGMSDSAFEQPLSDQRAKRAATGTRANGKQVEGRWRIYPELAAAGLWTTPTDLAKFAIEIARARQGTSKILSQATTETMLTPWEEGGACTFHLEKKNPAQFGHNGANEGFQGMLTMNWKTGQGLVVLTNSDLGMRVNELLLRSVAKTWGWKYEFEGKPASLPLIAKLRSVKAALARAAEIKATLEPEEVGEYEGMLNNLGYLLLGSGKTNDAITVFQRVADEFPASFNAWDSLAEAEMAAGATPAAIKHYEMSLELNPKNEAAREKLKGLKAP